MRRLNWNSAFNDQLIGWFVNSDYRVEQVLWLFVKIQNRLHLRNIITVFFRITQPTCFHGLCFFLKYVVWFHWKQHLHSSAQRSYIARSLSLHRAWPSGGGEQLSANSLPSTSSSVLLEKTRVVGLQVMPALKPYSTNHFFTRSMVFMLNFKTLEIVSFVDLSVLCSPSSQARRINAYKTVWVFWLSFLPMDSSLTRSFWVRVTLYFLISK